MKSWTASILPANTSILARARIEPPTPAAARRRCHLMGGVILPIRESPDVQSDAIAHIEFLRVTELLSAVDKNDALYESVINDYCMYKSDISRYMKMRRDIDKDETIDAAKRYKLIVDCDRQAETYRKKRFDIEKENGFTIASAMRAIPKKVDQKKNPVMEVLCDDAD